jgi:hypothetical protein
MRSDLRKQDGAGKSQAARVEAECDRLRQMMDALGDQIHLEGAQQRDRVETIVREVVIREIAEGQR